MSEQSKPTGPDLAQGIEERRHVECVDAAVDFGDAPLLFREEEEGPFHLTETASTFAQVKEINRTANRETVVVVAEGPASNLAVIVTTQ